MEYVKGYMIRTHAMIQEGKEQLFAVLPDGGVLSCIKNFSHSFYENGIVWEPVSELPQEAEYIGRYQRGGIR